MTAIAAKLTVEFVGHVTVKGRLPALKQIDRVAAQ